jgi:hypothetical protein
MARASEPAVTLPTNDEYQGPRITTYDPAIMQSEQHGKDVCDTLINEGWNLVDSSDGAYNPRRLEGDIVMGHPPHGDLYFNHDTEDYNWFVVPDNHEPLASDPNADYRSILGFGNFGTGEEKEHGRIEVENEYGALPENDAADKGYYGAPPFVWGNTGDRLITEGYWTFDCGHHTHGYRTEIHPAWMIATIRNMARAPLARGENRHGWVAPLGSDDRDFSPVTKADVWISSFGGEAVDNIFDDDDFLGRKDWWQPVNSKDYDFNIPAPVKPSPDAQLVMKIQDPPADFIKPPGASEPSFSLSNMTPFERDGRTFVHVHIPFKDVPDADYLLFAKSLIVGWDAPKPDVVHLRVTMKRWFVFDDLESVDEAEYSPWAQSGDQNLFVPITDGDELDDGFDCDSDGNYMPYCEPDNEENSWVKAGTSFDRFVAPDDPLVIQFRAKESDQPLDENDEAGIASQSFTAAENWGIGTHHLRQNDFTFGGKYPDVTNDLIGGGDDTCEDEGPNDEDECFEVEYTIERFTDPTATTISTPPAQYAQDPNLFTARVVTPGSPEKPRRHLPVTLTLSDATNTQVLHATTDANGVAAPTDLLTLPAGTYQLEASFAGNGLLTASSQTTSVTILKDATSTALEATDKIRWGHQDPFTVTLLEPNVGQAPQALNEPIAGKNLQITVTGTLGNHVYPIGPTGADGKATITPLMDLPPGNYTATACFATDAWYLPSCSAPKAIKITFGFSSFARGGPINFSGNANKATGDLHSEGSVLISGNSHVLSAAAGERFEYVTTFTDIGVGNAYNKVQVPPLGITPSYLRSTYCTGASTFMGVPVTYSTKTVTFKNDQVISGIYCVTGDIKIQSRVTGKVVLLATGLITTSGGGEKLQTADPTGADVLLLGGSTDPKAISIQATDSTFKGAIVSAGGVYISSKNSLFDTGLLGSQVLVSGSNNLLKAPQ